jgi:hypothetical protein
MTMPNRSYNAHKIFLPQYCFLKLYFTVLLSYRGTRVFLVQNVSYPVGTYGHTT